MKLTLYKYYYVIFILYDTKFLSLIKTQNIILYNWENLKHKC